jgi:hypothetical protein
VALILGILGETPRASGFPAAQALEYAVNPVTLLQAVVPDAFGSVTAPLERWWGGVLYTGGFPYFSTLYMGPLVLALAAVGAPGVPRMPRRLLLGLALLGLWYALGPWGGLAPELAGLPLLRSLRYPSKALFLPYLVTCLLAGHGADLLARGSCWRRLALGAGAFAGLVLLVGAAALAARERLEAWLEISPRMGSAMASTVPASCLEVALFSAGALAVAGAVLARKAAPSRAAALLAALVVCDLGLAGRGVNPQVTPSFFRLLPELQAERLHALKGGRVFTYGVEHSPAFRAFKDRRVPGADWIAFFVARQMLTPYNNVLDGSEVAYGPDRTSLGPPVVPVAPAEHDPRLIGQLLPKLRDAAVTRVLSLDALDHPDLRLRARVPIGPPGLDVHVYELASAWPRAYVACRVRTAKNRAEAAGWPFRADFDPRLDVSLEGGGSGGCREASVRATAALPSTRGFRVSADGPGYLVLRDAFARGWAARVDGRPAPVLRANGRHRAVALPAGEHDIVLRYEPPGLAPGLLAMAVAVAGTATILARPVLA